MSTPRQQRTNNARGTIQQGAYPRRDMTWSINNVVGPTVTFNIDGDITALQLRGLPAFSSPQQTNPPTACVLNGSSFDVTWDTPFPGYFEIDLPQGDTAITNNVGGVLCGGTAIQGQITWSVVQATMTTSGAITAIYTQGLDGNMITADLPPYTTGSMTFVVGQQQGSGSSITVRDVPSGFSFEVDSGQTWYFTNSGDGWEAVRLA